MNDYYCAVTKRCPYVNRIFCRVIITLHVIRTGRGLLPALG